MEPYVESLARRVARLETQNRRLVIVLTAIALLLAAFFVVAAKPLVEPADVQFGRIQAKEIVVSNQNRTELHIWSNATLPDGVAMDLTIKDARGKHVVGRFAAFGGSGQLSVSRPQEKQSIMLLADETVQLLQPGAGRGPGIVIRGDGPFVSLSDSKEYLGLFGAANLAVQNGSELNTTSAAIHLFSKQGKVIWQAP